MQKFVFYILNFILFVAVVNAQYLHHNLEIELQPKENFLKVVDVITVPLDSNRAEIDFKLHGDLDITSAADTSGGDYVIREIESDSADTSEIDSDVPIKNYRISFAQPQSEKMVIKIIYEGEINHPIKQISTEYARGFSETPGIISEEGVYLSGSSYWIPKFNDDLMQFKMSVYIPESWDVISEGRRTQRENLGVQNLVRWDSPSPVDEVHCIAAKFNYYEKSIGQVTAMAYLRSEDPGLATKYLETTTQYMEMYNKLIGPYPYSKFALIENFWETGYGMPSFTLLGPKVIRFPWILHSSYPHELLHNWWGNSVFVDLESGNWCEGLTAYLADHLIKEQRNQAVEYRRSALQAYTDYVNEGNEISLREFTSRHDAATSAIGYNKSLMLFNMLRQAIGDELFIKAIQTFYRRNQFKRAGFDDIRQAVAAVTGRDLQFGFDQWINRPGAPELQLADVVVTPEAGEYNLSYTLKQVQEGDSFAVSVPIVVHLAGIEKPFIQRVELVKRQQIYEMLFENEPLVVEVDPQFDVFRRLHRNEIPPALSQIFGSESVMIVLPATATDDKLNAYRELAEQWAKDDTDKFEIIQDSELINLPADRAVWILGEENRFRFELDSGLVDYDAEINSEGFRFGDSKTARGEKSVVVAFRNRRNPDKTVVWLDTDLPEATSGLARKLPHYSKYSYLIFEGEEPSNIVKGQWPVINSPLTALLLDDPALISLVGANLPERKPLASLTPVFSEERMISDIAFLASEEMQGRGLGSPEIDKAADYIADQFARAGLKPGGDNGTYFQTWNAIGGKEMINMSLKNVIAVLPGSKQEMEGESVLVCAHYDHLGLGWPDVRKDNEGKIHFGADDNASGVAVLIELARILAQSSEPDRTIVFAAFTGEESGLKGSRYYVKHAKKYPAAKIIGAINLDTVGRLGENKILVLNSSSASEWKHIIMGIGHVTGISHDLVSQDLDASDQVSFIETGIPAIQIFAGANADYHKPTDTIDKIDGPGLVKIAMFTKEAVGYLAEREEPLTFEGTVSPQVREDRSNQKRKVSTGIMPDFGFKGEGVKISYVSPASPAEKAGLQKGDIIIQLNYVRVANLKEYANELKGFAAGDEVTMVYLRDEAEKRVKLKFVER